MSACTCEIVEGTIPCHAENCGPECPVCGGDGEIPSAATRVANPDCPVPGHGNVPKEPDGEWKGTKWIPRP